MTEIRQIDAMAINAAIFLVLLQQESVQNSLLIKSLTAAIFQSNLVDVLDY